MKKKIQDIIIDTLKEFNEELDHDILKNPTQKTKLYGDKGTLDSLALVSFITDLEENISDSFQKDIVLADEKAMSTTTSPFRNVESLTKYIDDLLHE
jgi:acyl carrier protein